MGGETTRVENRGEPTRGETTREETSWGRNVLLPRELPSWICTNCVRGVLNGNGWDPFCAYRLIFMVTSLTICNRFSFNI